MQCTVQPSVVRHCFVYCWKRTWTFWIYCFWWENDKNESV